MSTPSIEICDERECQELDLFLVDRIYEFNARATGYFDGKLVGGRMRDETGQPKGQAALVYVKHFNGRNVVGRES